MYRLLVCVVLPWTATSAAPKSEEFAAKQRKDTSKVFGVGRRTSEAERHVRATVTVEPSGTTKQMEEAEVPPAIRSEAVTLPEPPLKVPHQWTPGIPVVTENDDHVAEVPKIVHFMFKKDLTLSNAQWPNPVWKASFESWRKHFPEPEYMYRFWTDSTIDRFFKDSCSEHYVLFQTYTKEIYKSDLSRYCILKNMGGIYADLDYEPRVNFYNDLTPNKVSLIQSAYHHEEFQNALMAAPVGDKFTHYWNGLFDLAELRRQFNEGPVEATGPKLLDDYPLNSDVSLVNKLSCSHYQPKIHMDGQPVKKECGYLTAETARKVKGIHWGTVSWAGYKWGQLQPDDDLGKSNHGDTERLFRMLHPEVKETDFQ